MPPRAVPQPFVSIVGGAATPHSLGGSFYCRIHDRGFATEGFFLDHLQRTDGVSPDDAGQLLDEEAGVWIFSGVPDEE